jgi:hypothetical protein
MKFENIFKLSIFIFIIGLQVIDLSPSKGTGTSGYEYGYTVSQVNDQGFLGKTIVTVTPPDGSGDPFTLYSYVVPYTRAFYDVEGNGNLQVVNNWYVKPQFDHYPSKQELLDGSDKPIVDIEGPGDPPLETNKSSIEMNGGGNVNVGL